MFTSPSEFMEGMPININLVRYVRFNNGIQQEWDIEATKYFTRYKGAVITFYFSHDDYVECRAKKTETKQHTIPIENYYNNLITKLTIT